MEFLGDSNNPAAVDVIAFVRLANSNLNLSSLTKGIQRSRREIPEIAQVYHGEAFGDFWTDQVGKSFPWCTLDCGRICD